MPPPGQLVRTRLTPCFYPLISPQKSHLKRNLHFFSSHLSTTWCFVKPGTTPLIPSPTLSLPPLALPISGIAIQSRADSRTGRSPAMAGRATGSSSPSSFSSSNLPSPLPFVHLHHTEVAFALSYNRNKGAIKFKMHHV